MQDETGSNDPSPFEAPFLTRARLLDGSIDRMIQAIPTLTLHTDAQREASLRAVLDARPLAGGGVWLFGYGSLIWNPTIHYVESRVAHIEGWRRSFCLSTPLGRGTPAAPGLVLALEEGGECTGVAFRIAEEAVEEELFVIWRREMLTGSYVPRWVELHDKDGHVFGSGIAFTINPAASNYAVGLSEDDVARRLATACGQLGSCSDYLFQTQFGLRLKGIADPLIDRLADAVTKVQAASKTG